MIELDPTSIGISKSAGPVVKFNQNHDGLGRFASGHGGYEPGRAAGSPVVQATAAGMAHYSHPYPRDNNIAQANAYEAMVNNPDDPAVKASYAAFSKAIMGQYHTLKAAGFKFEPQKGSVGYANSQAMIADLNKKHLNVFLTGNTLDGFASANHPMLQRVNAPEFGKDAVLNDVFRGVHDVMGHGVSGGSFGVKGERAAWLAHRKSLPAAALPALWNETRGQAAWTNAGPHMQTTDFITGATREMTANDKGFLKLPDRPFAEQKAGNPLLTGATV